MEQGPPLIVIAGPTGTGKTTQAHLALTIASGEPRFVAAGSLTARAEDSQGLDSVLSLAIDDVGRRLTPGIIDTLCELLDRRGEYMRRTIVTTNVAKSAWMEIDQRLGSRLHAGRWVVMDGPDWRRKEKAAPVAEHDDHPRDLVDFRQRQAGECHE